MPHEMRLSWRSRCRIAAAILVTFGFGVVGATAGVALAFRFVAAMLFLVGAATVVDAVVLTSSWRMTASALKMPTLLSRNREITGRDDLTVELADAPVSRLVVTGSVGTRRVTVNPLISGRDLRRWFDSLAEE